MGNVDFDFKPSVPVLDSNMSLGRRHDKPVNVDSVEGVRSEMERAGIGRGLVYAPHAAIFDSGEGNRTLIETVRSSDELLPQFVCNPSFDDLSEFAAHVDSEGVRSIRIFPGLHNYPFRPWVIGPWLDWLAETGIPVWLPVEFELIGPIPSTNPVDPRDIYDTLSQRPEIKAVLSEAKYNDSSWALPLVRSLPNLNFEISRFVPGGGITSVIEAIGPERMLFGSRFPDFALSPHLFSLHRSGLSEDALKAICAGNAERLLGIG